MRHQFRPSARWCIDCCYVASDMHLCVCSCCLY